MRSALQQTHETYCTPQSHLSVCGADPFLPFSSSFPPVVATLALMACSFMWLYTTTFRG